MSLAYINEIPERMPILEALLASSARGEIQLYASDLSFVEVAFAATEKGQRTLDAEIEGRIDSLWENHDVITMVEYHRGIGREARSLMRDAIAQRPQSWSLKPFDAIHLATAQWLASTGIVIEEFHTYDAGLFKYEPIVGFKVMYPAIAQPNLI